MKKIFPILFILACLFGSCKKCYECSSTFGNLNVSSTVCPGDALYNQAQNSSDCHQKIESNI